MLVARPLADPISERPLRASWAFFALTAAVLAVHAGIAVWVGEHMGRLGDAAVQRAQQGATLRRIDVAFVNELQATEPAPVVVSPRRSSSSVAQVGPPASAASAVQASSAPLEAVVASDEPAQSLTPATEPAPLEPAMQALQMPQDILAPQPQPGPESTAGKSAAAASEAAASAAAPSFEWPLSTRLSYHLVGNYRGPVEGSARVEWIRRGDLYQVHLDVSAGGVVSRRMSSEGRLTDQGLQPLLYEEVTSMLLREPRRHTVRFDADRVFLANGAIMPTVPQLQDTASQFVQLTWLFTTQRHRLKPGESVEIALALPRRIDRWTYDVQGEEEVQTPVGPIRALHMKPRSLKAPRGELLVESWFAPTLQYLPVRIIIRQGDEAYADLTLSRLPQQAAAAPEFKGR